MRLIIRGVYALIVHIVPFRIVKERESRYRRVRSERASGQNEGFRWWNTVIFSLPKAFS